MKIKDWIAALESIGDDEAIVGDVYEANGRAYHELTITTDEGEEFYDVTESGE